MFQNVAKRSMAQLILWSQKEFGGRDRKMKGLVKRLKQAKQGEKKILHHTISPMQSVFVPDRLITDNIIIGYECLHNIRHNKGKKKV